MTEAASHDVLARPLSKAQLMLRTGVARSLTNSTGAIIPYGAQCTLAGGVVDLGHAITQAGADCACICVQPGGVANGASGLFAFAPCIVEGLTGGIAGNLAFVSDDVPGEILPTLPFVGNWVKPIGRWISTTVLAFDPCPYARPNQREA